MLLKSFGDDMDRIVFTGYITGSVYHDYALMKNGFPGEGIRNGSVIAIKTHEFTPKAIEQFDKAILLVRDPFASIQVNDTKKQHYLVFVKLMANCAHDLRPNSIGAPVVMWATPPWSGTGATVVPSGATLSWIRPKSGER